MKRRLAALALAATMVAGTGLTVCAEGNVKDMTAAGAGTEVTGTGTMQLPTIDITVPTTADIVINPYQMDYELGEDPNKTTENKQIICAPQEIINESNVAVAVNVKDLTATDVKEGITISTTAPTAKDTAKKAFLYLEVVEVGADGATFADKYSSTSQSQVAIPYVATGDTKTKPGAKDAIVTLGAGDQTATKAQFTINGSVVANPTKTNADKTVEADPWTDADAFGVSFKFTFTPQINKAE